MIQFSIKQMERLTTVKADTIRVWEKRYGLCKPERKNNIRYYRVDDLKKFLLVGYLHRSGHRLPALAMLSLSELNRLKDASISEIEDHQDWLICELIILMYEKNPEVFEIVLEKCIRIMSLETVIEKVIVPFLYRTHLFWNGNLLTQEHFVVTLLRKKIMVAIDQVIPMYSSKRVVLLYLLSGKQLDLGLLYANYILKKTGWKVINVGRDISSENLADYFRIVNPDVLFTYSSFRNKQEAEDICNRLYQTLPHTQIITALYPLNKLPLYEHQNLRHQHYNTVLQDLCAHSPV